MFKSNQRETNENKFKRAGENKRRPKFIGRVGAELDVEAGRRAAQRISGNRTIQGWAAGTPTDSEDTLRFAELTGVRAMIETYPLEKTAEAYARMMSGHAQFRVVLTM